MRHPRLLAWLLVVLLAVPYPAAAPQTTAPPAAAPPGGSPPAFTPEQLEQVAAPIALYPDSLLAQVLMASTYPLEIVQAARFLRERKDLKGAQLDEALKDQTWDDSVKSLVSFPEVLNLMDGKLDWTQKLGDAFLAQQKDLLDAVQRLRQRAQAQGNLKSTKEQTVTVESVTPEPVAPGQPPPPPQQVIVIQPTNPQVVYVPSYNPTVVYGGWPYPAYPPAYPYPPGYAFGAAALSFGLGMAAGAAIWGNCNWGGGHADVNINNYQNYSKNVNRSNVSNERVSKYQQGQGQRGNQSQWQHNPENRRGVQYRDQGTQQRYNRGSNPQAVQSREQFRGRAEQGRQDLGRGDAGRSPGGGGRGDAGRSFGGGAQGGGRGQSLGGGQGFGGGREAGAFQGMGSGGDARSFSNRGQSSRQSMGAAGGASRPSGGGGGARAGGGGGGGRAGGGGGGGGGGGRGGGRR